MPIQRVNYSIYINQPKSNGQKLTTQDLVNVGYMSGRFGINLDGNPKENNSPKFTPDALMVNVNSCTSDLLEDNLNKAGIKFDKMA